jgi:hypothetical protein
MRKIYQNVAKKRFDFLKKKINGRTDYRLQFDSTIGEKKKRKRLRLASVTNEEGSLRTPINKEDCVIQMHSNAVNPFNGTTGMRQLLTG